MTSDESPPPSGGMTLDLSADLPEELAAFVAEEAARPEHGSTASVVAAALALYRQMRSDPQERKDWREAVLRAAVEGSPADETGGPEAEALRRLFEGRSPRSD